MGAFLLNEHFSRSDIAVDEVGAFFLGNSLDRNLEFHRLDRVFNAQNVVEEGHPERYCFAFFVAFPCPLLDELLCGLFLCISCAHAESFFTQKANIAIFGETICFSRVLTTALLRRILRRGSR